MEKFSRKALENEILQEAKVLKLSEKTVGKFVRAVTEKVEKWALARGAVTRADIDKKVAKELEKYNKDLAFIYEQKGKII